MFSWVVPWFSLVFRWVFPVFPCRCCSPLRLPRCPARPAEAGCPDAEASAGDGGAVDGTGQGTQGMPQLGLEGLGDAVRWLWLYGLWLGMICAHTHIYIYIYIIIEL